MSRAEIRQISLMALVFWHRAFIVPSRTPFLARQPRNRIRLNAPFVRGPIYRAICSQPSTGTTSPLPFRVDTRKSRGLDHSWFASFFSFRLIRPAQLLLRIQFKGKPGLRVGERGIIFESLRQGWGRFMARQGEVIVDAKVGEKISVLTRVQRKLTVTNRRATPDYDNWKRRKKGGKTAKKRGG